MSAPGRLRGAGIRRALRNAVGRRQTQMSRPDLREGRAATNLFLRLVGALPSQDSLLFEHWLIKVIK
jgi:hypothetical protein